MELGNMDVKFDIEKLLDPYKHGGTADAPVKRTLGTIASKLIYAHKFSPAIVGQAVFAAFWEIANADVNFKGDGTYGSQGRELFGFIRDKCTALAREESARSAVAAIIKQAVCLNRDCPMRTKVMAKRTRWQRFKYAVQRPRRLFWIDNSWRL